MNQELNRLKTSYAEIISYLKSKGSTISPVDLSTPIVTVRHKILTHKIDEVAPLFNSAVAAKGLTFDGKNIQVNLPDRHEYLYLPGKKIISDYSHLGTLDIQFDAPHSALVFAVVIVYDKANKQLCNKFIPTGGNDSIALQSYADATSFRIALRFKGIGSCEYNSISVGPTGPVEHPLCAAIKSPVLILSNQYPSYDDLYKYMFVHARMKEYQKLGHSYTVMCHNLRVEQGIREFNGIQVLEGNSVDLSAVLSSGKIKTVCVHFLDEHKFEAIRPYLHKIRLIVWVHGSEIQPHWRRDFNFRNDEERSHAEQLTERYMEFWPKVFELAQSNKIHFVFVSNYFKQEVFEDYKTTLSSNMYSIIHNPVDTNVFTYNEKSPELRKKIISIRPYSTPKYANDLTAKAIVELSSYEEFKDMHFHIAGAGELFNETTAPLRRFPNVTIENRFYNHAEIAALHKEYGICLVPTRMDSQGVSRDEAMAGGLVPVTSSVSAIPEFVDENCSILASAEDYKGLAEGILELYRNPDKFQELSKNAAERVRKQTAANIVTAREVALIENTVHISELRVACILDEFSTTCFGASCNLFPLTPEGHEDELAEARPHFLFVESAWKGSGGVWEHKIGKYSHNDYSALRSVINFCRDNGIPTIFWNKEDPVHFEKFIDAAVLFDYVYTTDVNMVQQYKARLSHNRVDALMFAAQPSLHYPATSEERKRGSFFAGSYYANRHKERMADMDMLFDAAADFPFDIYDRNAGTSNPDFQYPARFQTFIKGKLLYSEVINAYKSYQVALNVNSVTNSETMFSRRVFECLACGTPVVSTPSAGIAKHFSRIVPTATTVDEYKEIMRILATNADAWDALSRAGVREVLEKHTYAHRLVQICKDIGINLDAGLEVKTEGRDHSTPCKKILIYANIDLNLVDGSAIWLTSLADVLASDSVFDVHVLLKSHVHNRTNIESMEHEARVTWIEPPMGILGGRLEEEVALELLQKYNTTFNADFIITRQIDNNLLATMPDAFLSNCMPYLIIREEYYTANAKEALTKLSDKAKGFFTQTEPMRVKLVELLGCSSERVHLMPPMIPNCEKPNPVFMRNRANRLSYTGKFAAVWYMQEILDAVKRMDKVGIKLDVAGDKFHADVDKNALLKQFEKMSNVTYHGRISRTASMGLICDCDAGISWRDPASNNAHEALDISTKVLEYAMLGKPVLLNPTALHLELFGEDYPLYVDTPESFIEKVRMLFSDPNVYKQAAEKCYEVAKNFSYDAGLTRFHGVFTAQL